VLQAVNRIQPPRNTCVHCAQRSHDNRNIATCGLHQQVGLLRQVVLLSVGVAIGRTAKKTDVILLISDFY
jgi:hypothetical protein